MQNGRSGFDLNALREELLALNPWALGLVIDDDNAEFAAARQKATVARHAAGKDTWNTWAKRMLEMRSTLESANEWDATRDHQYRSLVGKNKVTRAWLGLASAVLSTRVAPHHFATDIFFGGFVFPSDARFQSTTFGGRADFDGAIFGDVAWFDDSIFSGAARFLGVTFGGVARFQRATFLNAVWFEDATFIDLARFSNATFRGQAEFRRTIFRSASRFRGASFEGAAWFEDASFSQVPNFISAAFKGVLRLDNIVLPRYPWFGYTSDKNATAHFRELKRRAAEAQDHERELQFFAQEIRTGRFHAKGLPPWVPKVWSWRFVFGLGFQAFSDFGRSLWRPLLTWLALFLGFAVFYLGEHEDMRKGREAHNPDGLLSAAVAYVQTTRDAWRSPPMCRDGGRTRIASTDALTEALILSFRNGTVFSKLDTGHRTYACLYGGEWMISPRVWLAGHAQSLASAILIFLFLRAVRNLLRLK